MVNIPEANQLAEFLAKSIVLKVAVFDEQTTKPPLETDT